MGLHMYVYYGVMEEETVAVMDTVYLLICIYESTRRSSIFLTDSVCVCKSDHRVDCSFYIYPRFYWCDFLSLCPSCAINLIRWRRWRS